MGKSTPHPKERLSIENNPNSCLAPTLQSCFETIMNLKHNNFNFGTTIYLKSRAERQAANRYNQYGDKNLS
jgi:hypothetical protein